jgi:hypothetical protein
MRIIWIDNTYPRNIYVDKKNRIFNVETHAGMRYLSYEISKHYYNIASLLEDLSRFFYHLEYFPNKNILNLDTYSLTDRFKKVSKKSFFKNNIN